MGEVLLCGGIFVILNICVLIFGPTVTFVIALVLLAFCLGALWGGGTPPPPDSTLAQKGGA